MTVMLQRDAAQIYIPAKGGTLVNIYAKPGETVSPGQVLASLENKELWQEFNAITWRKTIAEMELDLLILQSINDPNAATSIPTKKEVIETYATQIQELTEEVKKLQLVSPIAGTVIPPEWRPKREHSEQAMLQAWWGTPLETPKNLGATLEPGTLLCEVGDPTRVEIIIIVNQSKLEFIEQGQKVELKFEELPGETFRGEVTDKENRKMKTIPTQLSTKGKGEVPTTSKDGVEVPSSSSFRVNVMLDDNDDLRIKVGMTGRAKIHVAPQTIGNRLWRTVMEVFNFKL